MKADYLSYRRATRISLLGLSIQFALAAGMGVYARFSGDHAAFGAAAYMGIGLLIWLSLLLLFDQHRRDRIEAMEAETLSASGSAASSAFDAGSEELRVAARRLGVVVKFVIPAMSVLIGALLVGIGIWRLQSGVGLIDPDDFGAPKYGMWAIGVGFVIAFIGFVFARFVSGMAKQPVWSALRAGSACTVGSALFGLIIGASHFIDLAVGPDRFIRALQVAIPITMIVLGLEVFVNFILTLYLPRRAGEEPRPAFDSRLLGLLAAPDRVAVSVGEALSYQFGVDVTGSWFYQLLRRSIAYLVIFAVLIGWGMTCLVVIQPHQRALVLTYGRISDPLVSFGDRGEVDIGPGLHVKWPYPISTIEIPEHVVREPGGRESIVRSATGVRTLSLGTSAAEEGSTPILWTKAHTTAEFFNIVQPSGGLGSQGVDQGEAKLQRDVALVAIEVPVHFVVRDIELWDRFAAPGQQRLLLEAIGRRVVTLFLSGLSIDEVLASRRTELRSSFTAELEQAFSGLNNGAGPGIEILFVGAAGVHPPTDVAPSFERVIQSQQNREARIESAVGQQIRTLTEMAGSVEMAGRIVADLDQVAALEEDVGDLGARLADARPNERAALEAELAEKQDQLVERNLGVQHLLEDAGGEAGKLLLSASAQRWREHMGERARATLYQGELASYRAAPELYMSKKYLEAMLDAMRDARVFVTADDLPDLRIRIDLEDVERTDVFDPEAGAPVGE